MFCLRNCLNYMLLTFLVNRDIFYLSSKLSNKYEVQGLSDDLSNQTTTSDNKKIVYTEESENPIVDFITVYSCSYYGLGTVSRFSYFVWQLMF